MQTPFVELNRSDLEACKRLLRQGSKSFALASLLLPRRVRDPAAAVYAFCRVADDLIDGGSDVDGAIDVLHERLEAAYRGHPGDSPVDRAFSQVVLGYDIPPEIPLALLEGFAWDAQGRFYESLEDVQAYSARVAGTVGIMMTMLMGSHEANVLQRACDLGVAMQLTNIARDVGEDARAGRLYLPTRWMADAGIAPSEFLRDPSYTHELGAVVGRLLDRAEELYLRADVGIAMLPADCRPAIRAARLIYAEIGHQLARNGLDSVSRRTVVSKPRKLWLALRAWLGPSTGERFALAASPYQQLEETRFLIDASARRNPPLLPGATP